MAPSRGPQQDTRRLRHRGATLLGVVVCLLARGARADDAQQLEVAKSRLDAGQYEEVAARLATMLDPARPGCDRAGWPCRVVEPDSVERARALYVAALVALGKLEDADAQVELILVQNPAFTPSPALYPQEVIDRFAGKRAALKDRLEALMRERAEQAQKERLAQQRAQQGEQARLAQLEALASQETVIERRSRWIAALPLGVGQFQNGDTGLGIAFAAGEVAAGVTSIVTAAIVQDYASVDPNATVTLPSGQTQLVYDTVELNDRMHTTTTVNRVAFGLWAGLTVAGIVQAELAFVPERRSTRKRELPPLSAGVAPTTGGAAVSIQGRF